MKTGLSTATLSAHEGMSLTVDNPQRLHSNPLKKTVAYGNKPVKQQDNIESLRQSMRGQGENPRVRYEAFRRSARPSTKERGSSTTKTCQAVPTREYQSDLPSLIATRTLPQGFDKPPDENNPGPLVDRSIHISGPFCHLDCPRVVSTTQESGVQGKDTD